MAGFATILPAPLHFVQLSLVLAASTQQPCVHVLLSAWALAQHGATTEAGAASFAAKARLTVKSDAANIATIDLENFI